MESPPLYRQLATHYLDAIRAGSLKPGDKLPSLRSLMRQHGISLSTALQLCRALESEGWVEARDRSGYFVRRPRRLAIATMDEPAADVAPDPAQYVGIHSQGLGLRRAPAPGRGAGRLLDGARRARAVSRRGAARHHDAHAAPAARLLTTAAPSRARTPLREAAARRGLRAGMTLAPDDVLVTNGCIEALNLALRAVAQPGDTVAVESPTFYGLLQVLESLGMRALEIPTSPQTGLSVEALEMAIEAYGHIKAVVVVPHLQNPLGSVMPDAHKQRLVELCERHAIALIEDDTYSELLDADAPPRAIKSWDRTGNVIHCASLHKVLAPGLRLGWISAGRWHGRVEMLKYTQTPQQRGTGAVRGRRVHGHRRLRPASAPPARTAPGPARTHGRCDRRALSGRHAAEPAARRIATVGGIARAAVVRHGVRRGLARAILVAPGTLFSNSSRFDHYLRINCGWPYDDAIDAGLRRLGAIVGECAAAQAAPARKAA